MLRRVRRHPFPDFSAPIRPSDSLSFFGRRSGLPSLRGPPLVGDFFCAVPSPVVPARRVPCSAGRVGALWSGAPTCVSSGRERVSQVAGSSLCYVPWSSTPPVAPSTLPTLVPPALLPSKPTDALGFRKVAISGLCSHGPPARVPTHRRDCHQPRRKARFRPAGLSFGRSGLTPAGRLPEFPGLPHGHSFPTSISWSHP